MGAASLIGSSPVVLRLVRLLLLILVGVFAGFAAAAVMVRSWLPSRGDETSDTLALVAIFDGVDLTSRADAFGGGFVLAWFGGVALDLRSVTLAPGACIDVRAALGGVAITVPPGWRVQTEARALVGGVDAKVPEPDDPHAPRLLVRAASMLGGVSIAVSLD